MQIFLYAIGSWLNFLFIDLLFFLFFSWKHVKTFNLKIIPDTFSVFFILLCYFGIGLIIGFCLKGFDVLCKIFLLEKKIKWAYLSITISFGLNCIFNAVLLNKKSIWVIPFSIPIYIEALILLTIIILCVSLAVKFSHVIQKSPVIALFSVCTSGELFWSIIREGSFPGGWLKDSFLGYSNSIVILVAFFISSLVFTSIYFCLPRLFSIPGKRVFNAFLNFLLFSLLSAGTYDSSYAGQSAATLRRPNIVLIILDTLRADHLSCYGYPKTTTPNIDALTSQAIRYNHAYAAASYTLPSVASIVTGLYPCGHNANRKKEIEKNKTLIQGLYEQGLYDNHTTLAAYLKKAGYATAGLVSTSYLSRSYGFQQGFDYFDDDIPSVASVMPMCAALPFLNIFFPIDDFLTSRGHNGHRIASQINTSATSWLNRHDRTNPFFLMLHYFDVHHPYFPERLGMKSVPDSIINRYAACANYLDIENQITRSVIQGQKKLLPDEKDFLVTNYDRNLLLLDKKIGELFSYLKENKLYDESLIIILSDHGESFGEHNLMLHGICLYEDNLHVPLIIKYPLSDHLKGTVEDPVSLTGLVPTVLSYLSINIPDSIQGASFVNPQNQVMFAMNIQNRFSPWVLPELFQADTFSFFKNGYKLIKFNNGQDQLYFLNKDPYETMNVITRESSTGAGLGNDLAKYIEKYTDRSVLKNAPQHIDKSTLDNLRNLGYIK
jgi:arylsulfatase A-like enzyme